MTTENQLPFMQTPNLQIAHRGFSFAAPENTVAAFKTAIQRKVSVLEVDLMMSSDGVIVASHDYNLATFTNSTGFISDMTWEQLEYVQVTRGGNAKQSNSYLDSDVRLARFETIVKVAKETGVYLVVEIKGVKNQQDLTIKTLNILKEYDYIDQTLISSFFPMVLKDFKNRCPTASTMLLYNFKGASTFCNIAPESARSSLVWKALCFSPSTIDHILYYSVEMIAKYIGASTVGLDITTPNISHLTSRAIGWGLKVVLWTVNSMQQRELVNSIPGNEDGIVSIISDCPYSVCPAGL